MSVIKKAVSTCRTLFGKARLERELDDELRGAAAALEDRYRARGMTPDEARRAARIALGGIEPVKDAVRDVRAGVQLETFFSDVRYAARTLRKSPAFTAAAILSLALGIGANTAIFTFINALVLRPLPVREPSALVDVSGRRQGGSALISFPMYRDLAARQQVLAGIVATAGETPYRVTIPSATGTAGEVDNVRVSFVSGNYFSVIGVEPARGRVFTPGDDRNPDSAETAGSVIVLSDGFWQRQFGRDPAIVGRTILIGRVRCEVIGITPPGFVGEVIGNAADGWVPIVPFTSAEELDNRYGTFTAFFGRLRPGVTRESAQAQLTVLFQQLLAEEKVIKTPVEESTIRLESAAAGLDFSLRRTYLTPLFIVMGMVTVVLLIACANIANLMLARGAARSGEISVRLALGCSRARMVRQLLTESVLLSIAGAAAGLAISGWVAQSLAQLIYRGPVGLKLHLSPDARVFVFLAGLAIATAVLFGLAPAFRATRVDLAPALKGLRRGSGTARQRGGRILVAGQVALSLLLLVGAGLLVRSFQKLHDQDYGFAPERVLVFDLAHNAQDRTPEAMAAVERLARERVEAVPGVQSAGFSGVLIFSPSDIGSSFTIPGYQPPGGAPLMARYNSVSPGYIETVGMRMIAGRSIEERDNVPGTGAVAVINESMARRFFSERPREAVGRVFNIAAGPGQTRPVEIVGVMQDAKYNDLRLDAKPMFFLPFAQRTRSLRSLEVRTDQPAAAISGPVRAALLGVTKDIMVRRVIPLTEQIDQSLAAERLLLRLCLVFGGLALLLACIGLYGVIAYSVSQRTTEIGVRVALGATPLGVMRGVLRETMILVVAGIAVGIPASLAAGRLLVSFLYGLTPGDPGTLAIATLILLAAASLAAVLPARRAARVDPIVALRYE